MNGDHQTPLFWFVVQQFDNKSIKQVPATVEKSSMKEAWSGYVTHFKGWRRHSYSSNGWSYIELSNFVHKETISSLVKGMINHPQKGRGSAYTT